MTVGERQGRPEVRTEPEEGERPESRESLERHDHPGEALIGGRSVRVQGPVAEMSTATSIWLTTIAARA